MVYDYKIHYKINILKISDIKMSEILKIWELYELDDVIYEKAVKELEKIVNGHKKLTPEIAFKYIVRFLELWGVNRTPISLKQLIEVIESVKNDLKKLNGKKLISLNDEERLNIDEHKEDIKNLYTELKGVDGVGDTAVSKILHLLNPDVFVMWDEEIRKHYGIKNPTAEKYIEFMKMMQNLGLKFLEDYAKYNNIDLKDAEEKILNDYKNKPLSKLIDEYNWLVITKKNDTTLLFAIASLFTRENKDNLAIAEEKFDKFYAAAITTVEVKSKDIENEESTQIIVNIILIINANLTDEAMKEIIKIIKEAIDNAFKELGLQATETGSETDNVIEVKVTVVVSGSVNYSEEEYTKIKEIIKKVITRCIKDALIKICKKIASKKLS
ncbi:adenosylcobinamide amidohydrolase [Methanocaldococcus sp.]